MMKKLMLGIAVCACEPALGMLIPREELNIVRIEERKVAPIGEEANAALGEDESKYVIYTRKIDRNPGLPINSFMDKIIFRKSE